jgi:hypothetical protein
MRAVLVVGGWSSCAIGKDDQFRTRNWRRVHVKNTEQAFQTYREMIGDLLQIRSRQGGYPGRETKLLMQLEGAERVLGCTEDDRKRIILELSSLVVSTGGRPSGEFNGTDRYKC